MCPLDPSPPPPHCGVCEDSSYSPAWTHWRLSTSDVNKEWPCKDKDKDQAYKDQDKDKDFTYSYLLQVAVKPTVAIKQQQRTQIESSQHMTVKPITLNK